MKYSSMLQTLVGRQKELHKYDQLNDCYFVYFHTLGGKSDRGLLYHVRNEAVYVSFLSEFIVSVLH